MKFLTVPRLQRLSSLLQHVDLGDQIIHARVECYSCKAAGEDKRLGKQLERQISEELAHSPTMSPTMSPLGPLTDANTRKLLIALITTMNASFPDYDFSNLRAEQFDRELAPALAINALNTLFLDSLDLAHPGLRSEFWQAIHETVDLSQCELYSFTPHPDSDLDEGKLWSIRHFFYHRKEKKVVFIAAAAVSKLHEDEEEDDEGEEDVDVVMSGSSGGEAGGHWDEGGEEGNNHILWDELEFGEEGMRVISDEVGGERRYYGGGGRVDGLQMGRVREVTDAIPIGNSTAGARRKTKAKREVYGDDSTTAVGKGGDDDEKRKRRKKRTPTPKTGGEEAKKGKRGGREGKKVTGEGNGAHIVLPARMGSDDDEGAGGRSLLDANRAPSPAVDLAGGGGAGGVLSLTSLIEAKDPSEPAVNAQQTQPQPQPQTLPETQ